MFKWIGQRSERGKQKTRQLWENEFDVVRGGLDEKQVIEFVDDLIAQHRDSQQASADSLRSLLKTAITDAEQMAASIKTKAEAEAETEAANIINWAKQEDQEIKRKAEIAARKEAEDIVSVANKKAEITQVEAKQKALLFLLRAREEIEKEVREEYKRVNARLSSSLQSLVDEGQSIDVELKSRRAQLWGSKNFELEGQEATLLKPSEEIVPTAATIPPEEEAEQSDQLQDKVAEEKTEQPTQAQEETVEEIERETEQNPRLQEEVAEEKTEQPSGVQEDIIEEVKSEMEQPTQLQETDEKKGEQPIQIQEDVPAADPVEVVEEAVEPDASEEKSSQKEVESPPMQPMDSQALYTGEIELVIAIPVELKMVSKLYNYLQTVPDVKILRTTGSWDRGTTINVVADKPIPLIDTLSNIPDMEVIAEEPKQGSSAKSKSNLRLKREGKEVKRIKLTLKEAPAK